MLQSSDEVLLLNEAAVNAVQCKFAIWVRFKREGKLTGLRKPDITPVVSPCPQLMPSAADMPAMYVSHACRGTKMASGGA